MFDCFSHKQIKMASNDEELSIAVQNYCAIFDKSNKDFHQKDAKENTRKLLLKNWKMKMVSIRKKQIVKSAEKRD